MGCCSCDTKNIVRMVLTMLKEPPRKSEKPPWWKNNFDVTLNLGIYGNDNSDVTLNRWN